MRCQLTEMDMAKGQPCSLSESTCLVQRGQEDSGTLAKCGRTLGRGTRPSAETLGGVRGVGVGVGALDVPLQVRGDICHRTARPQHHLTGRSLSHLSHTVTPAPIWLGRSS